MPDEEAELQNYLSNLPDNDKGFQPIELSEIGVPNASRPNNDFESDPSLTLEQCPFFHDVCNPYTLAPTAEENPNLPLMMLPKFLVPPLLDRMI